ncbi:MAG: glucose 1-dehydrogenase [Spirochaetales bacterium]|nr:MAG: glucose 1-dehydrogenase [Spirochaetales bacterium]
MNILDKFRLDGKKVVITGGSKGIGKSVGIGLAQAGADIAIVARGIELAEETAHEIAAEGVKCIAVKADVTKPDDVDRMMKEILKAFGTVDVAFNNAGTAVVEKAEEMSYESLRAVIDLNLVGLFLTCQASARVMMKNRGGSIINMASMSAHVVNVPQTTANYNASKAGVVQLSKCLAVEWAQHKIRVNSLCPGYTLTELARSFSEDLMRQWIEKIPMKRMAEPEELQGAVLFLASDASSYCTGTDLIVDGGYTLW